MKELRNNFNTEIAFDNLAEAKYYFEPDLAEFPDLAGYAEYVEEIAASETLEQLADVLNHYSDDFGNGSTFYVKEF